MAACRRYPPTDVDRHAHKRYITPLAAARAAPLGISLTVEQRTLTPSVLVRIQDPQPWFPHISQSFGGTSIFGVCHVFQGVRHSRRIKGLN